MKNRSVYIAAALLGMAGLGWSQVKIAQFSARSSAGTISQEYLVLANHGTSAVNLQNYKIRRRQGSSFGNFDMTIGIVSIPAKGHALLASSAYGNANGAVEGSTADWVDVNGSGLTGGVSDAVTAEVTLALLDNTGTQLDAVSYNGGGTFVPTLHEGTAFTGVFSDPNNQVLRRKRAAANGPYTDSNNNSADLEIVSAKANPPNSAVLLPVSVCMFTIE